MYPEGPGCGRYGDKGPPSKSSQQTPLTSRTPCDPQETPGRRPSKGPSSRYQHLTPREALGEPGWWGSDQEERRSQELGIVARALYPAARGVPQSPAVAAVSPAQPAELPRGGGRSKGQCGEQEGVSRARSCLPRRCLRPGLGEGGEDGAAVVRLSLAEPLCTRVCSVQSGGSQPRG